MPVDKSQQRIRRMFGAIAPRYDRMNRLMTFGLDRRWRNRTVRSGPTDPDEPVLDVGEAMPDWKDAPELVADYTRSIVDEFWVAMPTFIQEMHRHTR